MKLSDKEKFRMIKGMLNNIRHENQKVIEMSRAMRVLGMEDGSERMYRSSQSIEVNTVEIERLTST